MSRLPAKNRAYMKKYYEDEENRRIKRKRDNDRYAHEKKNGKIPKGKELDHSKGMGRGKKQVISRTANRRKAAATTNRVRKKVN